MIGDIILLKRIINFEIKILQSGLFPILSLYHQFFLFSNPCFQKMFGFRCFFFKLKIIERICSFVFSFSFIVIISAVFFLFVFFEIMCNKTFSFDKIYFPTAAGRDISIHGR